jgi:hypothetical protein
LPLGDYYGQADGDLPSTPLRLLSKKGVWYVAKKAFYQFLFQRLHRLLKPEWFTYGERRLAYCNQRYNLAFSNERSIEIPVAQHFLRACGNVRVLEIGNVMSHYVPGVTWDIVDKYEKCKGVTNEDILEFHPTVPYDRIFSISTLEHIGYDEKVKNSDKIREVLQHIKNNVLTSGGCMFVTFPLGWNPELDKDFNMRNLPFDTFKLFRRIGWRNTWEEVSTECSPPFTYGRFVGADYVVFAAMGNFEAIHALENSCN